MFAGAFKLYFGLRERQSPTLDQIQTDALEFEANLSTTRKIQQKYEVVDKKKGRKKQRLLITLNIYMRRNWKR